jgi:hypothetical protein
VAEPRPGRGRLWLIFSADWIATYGLSAAAAMVWAMVPGVKGEVER